MKNQLVNNGMRRLLECMVLWVVLAKNYKTRLSNMLIITWLYNNHYFLNEEDNVLEIDATMFPSKYKKWIGGPYYNGTL